MSIPCVQAHSHILICSEPASFAWDEVCEVHPEIAPWAQDGQGHRGIPACSCPQICTPILKGASGTGHTCPWCPVTKILTQWAEMQHLHYFRHLEIKNFIIQILLAWGQICQLNAHLLVTEETWEATSQSAAHSRLELLSTALTPKEFSF